MTAAKPKPEPRGVRSTARKFAAAILLVLLGAAFWANARGWFSDVGSDRSAEFITQPSAKGVIRRTISATGALKARATVDVSSQLSGQIAKVEVDFNDLVGKGQVLAVLDRRGYQARVLQAEAEAGMARETVAIAASRRDRAQRQYDEAVAQRRVFAARIDKARAAVGAAGRQRARVETLQRQGASTIAAFEDSRANQETAEAALREAEALAAAHEHAAASLEAAFRESQAELVNARAALPLRDAALELVRLDLERSEIRSPIDGVVVNRAVEPGQTVAASLDAPVLFTIAGDLAKMEIHANIDEADIGEILAGQKAEFTVNAFPERTFAAQVIKIRKSAQLLQGVVTYTVVLETENADGRLLPGMTSTVRIVVEEVGPILTVPLAALRFTPDGMGVNAGARIWVRDGEGRIEPRSVTFGPDDRQDIAVLDGRLQEGEAVVLARARPAERGRFFGIRF